VNYATPRKRELADAFTALRHRRTLATAGRLLARNTERYLKVSRSMRALFAEFRMLFANTVELSLRLEFTLNDWDMSFRGIRARRRNHDVVSAGARAEGMQAGMAARCRVEEARAPADSSASLNLIEHLKLAGYS